MSDPAAVLRAVIEGRAARAYVPQVTHAALDLSGATMRRARGDAELMASCLAGAWERCRYDGVYAAWEASFFVVARALGVPFDDPEHELPVPRGAVLRGAGDLAAIERRSPLDDPGVAAALDLVSALRQRLPHTIPVLSYVPGPFTLAAVLVGHPAWRLVLERDEPLARAVLAEAARRAVEFASAKHARGAEVLVVADPAASASVLAPDLFRRFALSPLAAVVGGIAALGAIPSVHVCGDAAPLLEDLAATGARILEVDSPVDLAAALARLGDRVCLLGNLDPRWLRNATPEQVAQAARDLLAQTRPAARFLLSTGCEVVPGTRWPVLYRDRFLP